MWVNTEALRRQLAIQIIVLSSLVHWQRGQSHHHQLNRLQGDTEDILSRFLVVSWLSVHLIPTSLVSTRTIKASWSGASSFTCLALILLAPTHAGVVCQRPEASYKSIVSDALWPLTNALGTNHTVSQLVLLPGLHLWHQTLALTLADRSWDRLWVPVQRRTSWFHCHLGPKLYTQTNKQS